MKQSLLSFVHRFLAIYSREVSPSAIGDILFSRKLEFEIEENRQIDDELCWFLPLSPTSEKPRTQRNRYSLAH
jgi:hypothetical protein